MATHQEVSPAPAGTGRVSGDAGHLSAAASAMRPDVAEAEGQSRKAAAAGRQAASAAGRADVASAADSLAGALAKAIAGTSVAISDMSAISGTEGANFRTVGSGG